MVEFGGFEMPVSYSSIREEHHCVRQKLVCSMFPYGRILC